MDWFELMYKSLSVNVVCFSYRGFSDSDGDPTQPGLILDAQAAVDFCKQEKRINQDRVFVCGRSLGGAVAIHLTAALDRMGDNYIKGCVVENTFTSILEMADLMFPILAGKPGCKKAIMCDHWDSEQEVVHIKTPIYFIAGKND